MKREVQLSRKTVVRIGALALSLAILGVGLACLRFRLPSLFQSAPTSPPPDAQAAVAGVKAIYTLDYTEDAKTWQERVCAVSTAQGCAFFQSLLAPAMRKTVEQKQIRTGCEVQAVRLVEEDGQTRVWELTVTLDNPWPGVEATMPVYAAVEQQEDGSWLFQRILFTQEVEARYGATASPEP